MRKLSGLLELLALLGIIAAASSVMLSGTKMQTMTLDHGKLVYKGEVRDSRLNGMGELTYDNGDSYKGQFTHGVFSGRGTFSSAQGWQYEGEFQKGQAHGQGKLTLEDGRVFEGKFKQGMYQK